MFSGGGPLLMQNGHVVLNGRQEGIQPWLHELGGTKNGGSSGAERSVADDLAWQPPAVIPPL